MRKLFLLYMLAWIPAIWNPLCGDTPRVGISHPQTGPTSPGSATDKPAPDQIGTKARPFVVDIEGHIQTPGEAADAKKKAEWASDVERRTIDASEESARYAYSTAWATWALVVVGILAAGAAVITLRQIKRQADLMDTQLALANRAFLFLNEIKKRDGTAVAVRIENQGRVSATVISVDAEATVPAELPFSIEKIRTWKTRTNLLS